MELDGHGQLAWSMRLTSASNGSRAATQRSAPRSQRGQSTIGGTGVPQTWIVADQNSKAPGAAQYFSFNTPVPTDAEATSVFGAAKVARGSRLRGAAWGVLSIGGDWQIVAARRKRKIDGEEKAVVKAPRRKEARRHLHLPGKSRPRQQDSHLTYPNTRQ